MHSSGQTVFGRWAFGTMVVTQPSAESMVWNDRIGARRDVWRESARDAGTAAIHGHSGIASPGLDWHWRSAPSDSRSTMVGRMGIINGTRSDGLMMVAEANGPSCHRTCSLNR